MQEIVFSWGSRSVSKRHSAASLGLRLRSFVEAAISAHERADPFPGGHLDVAAATQAPYKVRIHYGLHSKGRRPHARFFKKAINFREKVIVCSHNQEAKWPKPICQ